MTQPAQSQEKKMASDKEQEAMWALGLAASQYPGQNYAWCRQFSENHHAEHPSVCSFGGTGRTLELAHVLDAGCRAPGVESSSENWGESGPSVGCGHSWVRPLEVGVCMVFGQVQHGGSLVGVPSRFFLPENRGGTTDGLVQGTSMRSAGVARCCPSFTDEELAALAESIRREQNQRH